MEPYGMLILMLLIGLGVLGRIITPIVRPILMLLLGGDIM